MKRCVQTFDRYFIQYIHTHASEELMHVGCNNSINVFKNNLEVISLLCSLIVLL